MAIWSAQVETPQRLVIFKRPYKHEEAMKAQVEGFALHSSTVWGHPSKELVEEIGKGIVVSHSYAVYEGMEILTFVVTDE